MLQWSGHAPVNALLNAFAVWLEEILVADPNEAQVHLYQNDYTPSIGSVLADFTEATFDGYGARDLPVYNSSRLRVDSNGAAFYVFATVFTWLMTGDVTPNTVYGYYITNQADDTLYAAGRFATPVDFSASGVAIDVELAVRFAADSLVSGDDTTVSSVVVIT